jgi:uncharacterized protein
MEISKNLEVVDAALWLKKEKIIIINDLHLGYEGMLLAKGVLSPRFQLEEIIKKMELIIHQTKPNLLIVNGDLKHEFGKILKEEWKEVSEFLDFVSKKVKKIIIIQGNHDPIIKPIANKKNIEVISEYQVGEILIVHGDSLVETKAKRIIIGHEHPAITIREGSKFEKYKCFLKGKWGKKEIIVVPSFNPLLEGTDVLKGKLLSPFLNDIHQFEVYVVNKGEVFKFGKILDIKN